MASDGATTSDPGSELVEVVDPNGDVLSIVTRSEMRASNLRHRCSYIGVLRSSGCLVVHQRAGWKDTSPLFWDICFGGVVDVGEAWESAARRELHEEAGLSNALGLRDLGPVQYDGPQTKVVGHVYVLISDDALTCPDGEVIAVDEVPLTQIEAWLEGRQVCEDSLEVVLPLISSYGRQDLKSL